MTTTIDTPKVSVVRDYSIDIEGKTYYRMRANDSGLLELIGYLNKFMNTKESVMVEIGSYIGDSTKIFCKHFKEIITIDPYIDNNHANPTYAASPDVQKMFLRMMAPYTNWKQINKTSDDAVNDLKGRQFDFIYIDGYHIYEWVKRDVLNYYPLVRKGGFLAGHDYHPSWPDVPKAVNEIFNKNELVVLNDCGNRNFLKRK